MILGQRVQFTNHPESVQRELAGICGEVVIVKTLKTKPMYLVAIDLDDKDKAIDLFCKGNEAMKQGIQESFQADSYTALAGKADHRLALWCMDREIKPVTIN